MTRQEAVIKIVKITRIIGELKYQLDADDEVEFEALDPEWKHIAEWTQEVCRYMELDASPQVARLIANIGFTDMVEKYVQSCRKEIGAKEAKILDDYVKHMRTLSSLCDTRSEEQREKYGDLIEPLANERVAALLQRAVDAGILDRHYQPVPQTSPLQLKVIAYAVRAYANCTARMSCLRNNGTGRTGNGSIPAVSPSTIPFATKRPGHSIPKWILPDSNPYTKPQRSMCRKARRRYGPCTKIW